MYSNETLELENVRQMLQNNKLMKKTDSTEDISRLFIKGQSGRSKGRGPKRDPETSNSFSCYFCKKPGHIKINLYEIQGVAEEKRRQKF